MRIKIEYEDENYYFSDGKWFTSSNVMAPMGLVSQLNKLLLASGKVDTEVKTFAGYLDLIDKTKDAGNYQLSYKYAMDAIHYFPTADMQSLLPRLISIFRLLNRPEEAISVANEYISKYGKDIESPMLFTSIAAAYCDIEDYETAREYANKAYAKFKGHSDEELFLVYKRIESMQK